MARDRNTFAKRQRETGKRQKAEEKRARRRKKKEFAASAGDANHEDHPVTEQELSGPAGP
jgi:hypothetical protein